MAEEGNGILNCEVAADWAETKHKVDEMHNAIREMRGPLKHLEKLESIAATNADIRDRLISPATAVGRVDVKVIMPIIYVLCGVIFCMIVWFTGVEPNLPHHAAGHSDQTK
jgi:hypothetical protein